jgi:hypothetical protein
MSRYQHGTCMKHSQPSTFNTIKLSCAPDSRSASGVRIGCAPRNDFTNRAHRRLTRNSALTFMSIVNGDVVVGEDMPIADFWTKYVALLRARIQRQRHEAFHRPRFQTDLESVNRSDAGQLTGIELLREREQGTGRRKSMRPTKEILQSKFELG